MVGCTPLLIIYYWSRITLPPLCNRGRPAREVLSGSEAEGSGITHPTSFGAATGTPPSRYASRLPYFAGEASRQFTSSLEEVEQSQPTDLRETLLRGLQHQVFLCQLRNCRRIIQVAHLRQNLLVYQPQTILQIATALQGIQARADLGADGTDIGLR